MFYWCFPTPTPRFELSDAMFEPVESPVSFPKLEESIAEFWKKHGVYEKSLDARSGAPAFVFYEGPPTANGLQAELTKADPTAPQRNSAVASFVLLSEFRSLRL